jgi:hypothetical protein
LKEEERKMKAYKFNHQDRRFAPWTVLCVLSLLAAMVFAVPSVVFAQTFELSQDCDFALIDTEHTITATVTDDNGDPVANQFLLFLFFGANVQPVTNGYTNSDGIVEITFPGSATGETRISMSSPPQYPQEVATTTIYWTADEADLCLEPESPGVTVGGRMILNAKKRGALRIAVCGTDEFDVSNVDPKSVELAGVAPWHWKQKDSRLCLDGKDGFVDLVLKFKNREVIEALASDLEDTDGVTLALTGELKDGTAFGGEWQAEIKNKGKRHGKKVHHPKKAKKNKRCKK